MLLFALLPLLILIICSLWRGVRFGVVAGMLVSLAVYYFWSGDVITLGAIGIHAVLLTCSIILIITGALLLNAVLQKKGLLQSLEKTIAHIHPARELRFFIILMVLTPLLEWVAGFGTPGTIVPIILITLGYSPILSIASVLLIDSVAVIFGALGTPIIGGLQIPLELPGTVVSSVSTTSSSLVLMGGVVTMCAVMVLYKKWAGELRYMREIVWLYVMFSCGFLLGAWLLPETAAILASVTVMCGALVLHPSSITRVKWSTFNPVILLVVCLLLQKIPHVGEMLGYLSVEVNHVFGTAVHLSFAPLLSPFLPLAMVTLYYLRGVHNKTALFRGVVTKMGNIMLLLFPTIVIAQILLFSESPDLPSQASYIAQRALSLGEDWYMLLTPMIGLFGTFVAGSTTVSNLIFGPAHVAAAQTSSLELVELLSLQTVGGGFGNAICFFNIIAACAATGIKDYGKVLIVTMIPTLLAVLVVAIVHGVLLSL